MKAIKVLMIALVAAFTVTTVNAQTAPAKAKTTTPAKVEKKTMKVEKKTDTVAKKAVKKTKKAATKK